MTRRWLLIGLGCAALLAIVVALALHSSYSPGPLLKGHQAFGSNCAACHEPWRGVAVASTGCVDCHGKMPDNPHSGTKVSDTTSGLIAGRKLLSFHDNLACMSCHTDHIGRVIDLADTSGRNCAWCHQHDSIEDVSAHRKKPMLLSGATVQLFDKPFSHQQHLQDTIDHLQKATQQVQKLRSPDRKKQAEAEVAALSGVLDSSGQHLQCRTCHIVQPGVAGHRDKFAIAEAGCTISGCHASWRDPELKLADIAPQYAAQQSPDTPEPALIDYVAPDRFQFVKAVFAHSEGHLRSKCGECHLDMESSAKPGDFHGKRASNCFTCHAHESGTAVTQKAESSLDLIGARVAMAALHPPSEKNVTGCAECHAFHINYHGATRILDFTKKAPTVRPRPAPGLRLAFYSVHLSLNHKTDAMRLHVRPSTWHPWLIGLTAIMIGGIAGFAYIRYFPLPAATRVTRATVAPQRTPEIPALDDSFQHRERPLCRRRNGRDRIDQSGDAIRTAGSRLYRECAQGLATDGSGDIYDLAIVGCGPAGIGATTTAKKHGLKYIALEETTAASTIRNYPRGKFVQATPIDINEYGAFMMEGDNSKESLVKKWMEMIAATQIAIEERQEVTGINYWCWLVPNPALTCRKSLYHWI